MITTCNTRIDIALNRFILESYIVNIETEFLPLNCIKRVNLLIISSCPMSFPSQTNTNFLC